RRGHTRCYRDWSSDVCSSDLVVAVELPPSAVFVSDEKRTAVGIPLGECLTREIKLDVVGRVRSRVEDQRLAAAAPVVQHEQTLEIGRASCREGGETEDLSE